MSDIAEALKDAVHPKRREQSTAETYDPHKRGPYPDQQQQQQQQHPTSRNDTKDPGFSSTTTTRETGNPASAEQTDLSNPATMSGRHGGSLTSQTLNTGEEQHQSSAHTTSAGSSKQARIADALEQGAGLRREGDASQGLGEYGGGGGGDIGAAAAKPVYKEGGKYGLS
ncbi:hypothetical protein N658DRAFT_500155 [Parathielavia hyrcaniae]|uniref:Uncharacterized protein n=1 Tax=Parathielavia hyrcaniae TaxID=113614 RepID=A0AAN6PTZ1_9PEZI|nr:hypothetical protein N658DRAFT_500155 [Parathielavia hyrcaniae]